MNTSNEDTITPFPYMAKNFEREGFQAASDVAILFTLHNARGLVAEAEYDGYQENASCRIRVSFVRESSCGNRRIHHLIGWLS